MTTSEFVKKYNGGKHDYDGKFSSQCVDLMRFYIRDVLSYPQPLSVTGAKDFWSNYSKDLNLKNYYEQIKNTPDGIPQEGDIILWDKWASNPFGHVAICLNGNLNEFDSIDQNWDGKLKTQIVKHNYLNPPVLGWLRPNQFMNFIDLKKRLSDISWSELKEFSDLEKRNLIERADSIQTMTIKWLKSNSDMAIKNAELIENEAKFNDGINKIVEVANKSSEKIEELTTQLDASQAEVNVLIRKHKNETEVLRSDKKALKLEIEGLKKSSSPLIQIDFTKLTNFLKTWSKK